MRKRLLFAPFSLLIACTAGPASIDHDAHFGAATPAAREAAVQQAVGNGAAIGVIVAFAAELDNLENPACPTRELRGESVVYRADGCTGASGTRWSGGLMATNVPSFSDLFGEEAQLDESAPMELVFDELSYAGEGFELRFDGRAYQSALQLPYRLEQDLTVTAAAGSVRVVSTMACAALPGDGGTRCVTEAGAYGELDGEGFALAAEVVRGDGGLAGIVELSGLDRLRVDLAAADDSGCAPATIDGVAAGLVCLGDQGGGGPGPEPQPETSAPITGASWACGGTIDVTIWVAGDAASAEVVISDGAREETHALALAGSEAGEALWQATLVIGADTAFDCDAFDSLGFTARAVAADGSGTACTSFGDESVAPACR